MTDRTRDIVTLDSLLDEIEDARLAALNENDYKTMLNCTMSKSKLLGGGFAIERRQDKRDDPLGLKMFD